jgi:hypothetical protein
VHCDGAQPWRGGQTSQAGLGEAGSTNSGSCIMYLFMNYISSTINININIIYYSRASKARQASKAVHRRQVQRHAVSCTSRQPVDLTVRPRHVRRLAASKADFALETFGRQCMSEKGGEWGGEWECCVCVCVCMCVCVC